MSLYRCIYITAIIVRWNNDAQNKLYRATGSCLIRTRGPETRRAYSTNPEDHTTWSTHAVIRLSFASATNSRCVRYIVILRRSLLICAIHQSINQSINRNEFLWRRPPANSRSVALINAQHNGGNCAVPDLIKAIQWHVDVDDILWRNGTIFNKVGPLARVKNWILSCTLIFIPHFEIVPIVDAI